MDRENGEKSEHAVVDRENQRGAHGWISDVLFWLLVLVIVMAPALMSAFGRTGYVCSLIVGASAWLAFAAGMKLPRSGVVLFVALALHVFTFRTGPALSDDVWRYLWDGRVSSSGINPYELPPSSEQLRDLRASWHDRINHPEIRSIYPPYAQLTFVISALFGGTLVSWRFMMIVANLGIIALLWRSSSRVALLWSICPVVIWEGVWNLHVDLIAALAVVGAWRLVRSHRNFAAGALLGIATGIKVTPAVLVASAWRASSKRSRLTWGFFAAIIAGFVPFLPAGPFMPGAKTFLVSWSFNSPLYETLTFVTGRLGVASALKGVLGRLGPVLFESAAIERGYSLIYPEMIARVILALAGVAAILFVVSRIPAERSGPIAFAILLLASPTIHPWYWLPILPLAMLSASWVVVALAMFSGASYLIYDGAPPGLVMTLSYGVPMLTGWLLERRSSPGDPEPAIGASQH